MKIDAGQTLARQLEMLRVMPRAPRKVTAALLQAHLHDAGYEVSRRTVERDLHALSERFPLVLDDRARPFGWSWALGAHADLLPGLTMPQAVSLLLSRSHIKHFLPRSMLAELEGLFALAERAVVSSGWKDWHTRTATIGAGISLTPPQVDLEVLNSIQSALSLGKCLLISYRQKGKREIAKYRIHPLGILARAGALYLVATFFDYSDVRQLAIHRITKAEVQPEQRQDPPGFDFAFYAAGIGSTIGSRGLISLVLRFDAAAAEHLREMPLSKDQSWNEIEGGNRVELSATVADDDQLRWWLRAFGAQVEVVSPRLLRSEMRHELEAAINLYVGSAGLPKKN